MQTVKRSRSNSAALSALKSILSQAQAYRWTSAKVIAEYGELHSRFNLPAYSWEYLRGYRDAVQDAWHQNGTVVFRYVMPDGRLMPAKWDDMSEADRDAVRMDTPSGFFWAGTDAPYFVSGTKA